MSNMNPRRVSWRGSIGLVSGDHLTQQIKLRVIVDDTIPQHGGRRIVVELTKEEAESLCRQLQTLSASL